MNLDQARHLLLEHARHPRNRISQRPDLTEFDRWGDCQNPLCGDQVKVLFKIRNNRIDRCALEMRGCTICTASASLMSEILSGLTPEEALDLRKLFGEALFSKPNEPWPERLSLLEAFSNLRISPARVPCALIPWYAMKEALQKKLP